MKAGFRVSSLLFYLIPNYCWEWNPNFHFSILLNTPKHNRTLCE